VNDIVRHYARVQVLYGIEDMRPVNELRMKARWKLDGTLAAVEGIHGALPKLVLPGRTSRSSSRQSSSTKSSA
jgi:hypothetical protein